VVKDVIVLYLNFYYFVKLVLHFMGLEKRKTSNKKLYNNHLKILRNRLIKILFLVALKAQLKIRLIYMFLILQMARI